MKYAWQIHTVVRHGTGEKLAALTRKAGARGGTILVGRGQIRSPLLRALELADVERDILITLVTEAERAAVFSAIQNAPVYGKRHAGISYIIPTGGATMSTDATHELITIIVNRGYADDVMAAARKAGAQGGTILNARGTGKADDEKFFGITIVPEKEQVLILADRTNAQSIKDAIASLPCLTTPGIGIMYSAPVADFVQLGKKG